jgi:hypothetical protein
LPELLPILTELQLRHKSTEEKERVDNIWFNQRF